MIKKIVAAAAAAFASTVLFAYNPPVSGESLDRLTSPAQLTSASSSAGGGLFSVGPDSIVFNPALIAYEQRITLDFGYTALFSSENPDNAYGSAFETGILIPWKWFVGSGIIKGDFLPFDEMNAGNTLGTNIGIAKEVSEHLSVGIGMNAGLFWGAGSDWSLGANIGALYRLPQLGFMKDFRIGVSMLNLGKNYTFTTLEGIDSDEDVESFPQIATLRAGAAAVLFSNDYFKGGVSLDFAIPGFQNLIIDTGLQLSFNNMLFLRASEEINIRESIAGYANYMPSLSLGYRFTFSAKNNTYLEKNGWGQSEMTTSAAWQQLYQTVNACSFGVRMNLGMQDTDPPLIELWDGEEDQK
ncbi:MAG TPA: hypothetical protein DCL73_08410 [Treponema sp.]|nr:hypothetical protein [Treponema sp.]